MISAQELQGKWTTVRGQIKKQWGQLTDDDLQWAGGNVDQLIGKIQQKTGEAKQQIETFLTGALDGTASGISRAAEAASEYAQGAMDTARRGYQRAEAVVQEHPTATIGGAFFAGLFAGVVIGMLACNRN